MKAIAPTLPVSDIAEALSYYEQALGCPPAQATANMGR